MKKPLRIIIPVLFVIIGVLIFYMKKDQNDSDTLMVSGSIEIRDVRLSFKIPGILKSRKIEEGDTVQAGQVVAELDDVDLELAVNQAQNNRELARAVLSELESGSRPQEIKATRAELERTRAGHRAADARLKLARADHERLLTLFNQGGISKSEYEKYQTRLETARNAYDETAALVRGAQERLSLIKEGARPEKIQQARMRLAIAEEMLEQARQQLSYTVLVSPIEATVMSTSAEQGEYLAPGSVVVTMGDLKNVWVRAYVNETDLGKIRLKQQVDIKTDTYPEKIYKGRISYINSEAEFTPKTVQTFEERVKLVYRIKIECENPDQELKAGMPADAVIDIRGDDGSK